MEGVGGRGMEGWDGENGGWVGGGLGVVLCFGVWVFNVLGCGCRWLVGGGVGGLVCGFERWGTGVGWVLFRLVLGGVVGCVCGFEEAGGGVEITTPSSDSLVGRVVSPYFLLPGWVGRVDSISRGFPKPFLSYFNDSSLDYETFCFDIEENSSGSTTPHSDLPLPEYESFCFDVDHIKEKSSGSITSHSNLSLLEYESFHFDLSIDQLPPADRSDSQHEEFIDELAHIISPTEYDHFYFNLEDDP
ncbi:hypothetical protein Tco_1002492 [Tanacetum coccineum]|uniref:Uncharacterized protein n=1 Tax=Tanacetum coccineum TaxID=301880 RepID=A0ABQ5F7B1_9ASTR